MRRRGLRRLVRVVGGALLAAGACAAIGLQPPPADGPPGLRETVVLAALLALAIAAVARRLRFRPPSARARRVSRLMRWSTGFADLELGLALLAGWAGALAVSGGAGSPLHPLGLGIVAFATTFLARAPAVVVVLAALALEAAAAWTSGAWIAAGFHGGFLVAAAVAHAIFLRGLVARHRGELARRVADAIRRHRESARDYRLIAAALGPASRAPRGRTEEEEVLAAGSVEIVSSSVFHTLSLVKRALEARSIALLWLDERGDALKIKELLSDSERVVDQPSLPLHGAIGAVVRDRAVVNLPSTRAGQVVYYDGAALAGAFVAVPVMDGAHLRGVLCADRDAAFDERDAALVAGAAEQVMHTVHAEQVFGALERAKYEHERFYHASAMLGRALTLEQVVETAFGAAAEIVEYDLGVITLFAKDTVRHKVQSVRVNPNAPPIIDPAELASLEFRDNASLVSMVVKNRHYLPASGDLRDDSVPLFTRRVKLKGCESLVVLPLTTGDEAIGTISLLARGRGRFRKDTREMLGVIANQVAISLQNALMYKRMETMATTDGLTGLTNHRTFQERFGQLLDRSARHGHKAAVLLCDVDHFKKVNDTYGHPVGDEVLRRVARVLGEAVRKIDIPARYGGEEFAVVLEATDLEGATGLAERIRKDVAALEVDSDKGKFQVTMSIGVAAFPDDSREQSVLIERADLALYQAKQGGRNRVVAYRDHAAAKQKRAS